MRLRIVLFSAIALLSTAEVRAQAAETGSSTQPHHASVASTVLEKKSNPKRVNLGFMVNSRYEEVNPIISSDGTTLYFARKGTPANTGGKHDPQDIWITEYNGVNWSKSRNAGPAINSASADNLCAVSADNTRLYFFIKKGNIGGYFVYRERTESGWSLPVRIGPEVVNESAFLEAFLSRDERVLLFTAKSRLNIRYSKDFDERDIYVSILGEDGKWSRPAGLGPTVNSPGDEFSPFLAEDGLTLYFATNGRGGFGGVDIFMSRRTGPGWQDWSVPVNVGNSVNTPGNDAYFSLTADGSIAYLASDYGSIGGTDIVRVTVPSDMRPFSIEAAAVHSLPDAQRIYFAEAGSKPLNGHVADLEQIVKTMIADPSLKLEIRGHTDNRGSSKDLMALSGRRVAAIVDYLVGKGIARNRIIVFSFGSRKPADTNDCPEGRARNRRVECYFFR